MSLKLLILVSIADHIDVKSVDVKYYSGSVSRAMSLYDGKYWPLFLSSSIVLAYTLNLRFLSRLHNLTDAIPAHNTHEYPN